MASFTVDIAAMRQKAGELIKHADAFDSICSKLKKAATTMGSAYESGDKNDFVTKIEECCEHLKGLSDKIRNASGILSKQAGEYEKREEENKRKAQGLPG